MLDVVIIGGGPAGLAAAVYFARQKLSFMLLTMQLGGQALWSADVENYLGFHLLDGQKLVRQFQNHLKDYQQDFSLKEGEEVHKIDKLIGGFTVTTASGHYQTRTVLIASGTKHRELGVPGEKEFYGHGVTYCAACDAPLFRGKTVIVVGGGNSALDAALFTEKYANQVQLVAINPTLQGDDVMRSKVQSNGKIKVRLQTKVTEIIGTKQVTGVRLAAADGTEHVENCDAVFIEIGLTPATGFIDFVGKDRSGQILIDKLNATNVEGIWAAGDATDVTEKQISVAVGEGSKAALSIINYFQTHH